MSFNTDQQTLNDLVILPKPGIASVFDVYNKTHTRKGAAILEEMFTNPLNNAEAINNRVETIRFFSTLPHVFPFRTDWFDHAELYLETDDDRTALTPEDNSWVKKLTRIVAADAAYSVVKNGVASIIEIVNALQNFIQNTEAAAANASYKKTLEAIKLLLGDEDMQQLLKEKAGAALSYKKLCWYDNLLRFSPGSSIKKILAHIYTMDVYFSVAKVAMQLNLTYPKATAASLQTLHLKGVYHPLVKGAVGNNISITPAGNIIFLTGANMAGKSTFMKSMGVALFVAHVGFPVAAQSMEFSVRDGIYTTINLADDITMGSSHFYAEVLRVKKMAKELSLGKNLFIIFDELFRGTNVKDAYEATIAVTEALAGKASCMFVVSTHIIEAGTVLKQRCSNINFIYLPTIIQNNKPVYTYKLQNGITEDRHGMVIIHNEKILDILQQKTMEKNVC